MTRVYGRVHLKATATPLMGNICFEPKQLGFMSSNVLFASRVYTQLLDENGAFDIDVFPGKYYVHLSNACTLIDVPMVNEITLKELLKAAKI